MAADAHWCRSDVRYKIAYTAQDHGTSYAKPSGVTTLPDDGHIFTAFGRSGCYYTAMSLSVTGSTKGQCVYAHPVPRCTDPTTRKKRDWTAAELATWHDSSDPQVFDKKSDGTSICETKTAPVQRAGFSDDPCAVASFRIYENRPAGADAAPGAINAHRTVTYASSWDLNIADAHPYTASPPRDTTAGTADPAGCAAATKT